MKKVESKYYALFYDSLIAPNGGWNTESLDLNIEVEIKMGYEPKESDYGYMMETNDSRKRLYFEPEYDYFDTYNLYFQ